MIWRGKNRRSASPSSTTPPAPKAGRETASSAPVPDARQAGKDEQGFEQFYGRGASAAKTPKASQDTPPPAQPADKVLPFEQPSTPDSDSEAKDDDSTTSPHAYGLFASRSGGFGLIVHAQDKAQYLMAYADLLSAVIEPSGTTAILSTRSGLMITLTGEHFDTLLARLRDRRVNFIRAPGRRGDDDISLQTISVEQHRGG